MNVGRVGTTGKLRGARLAELDQSARMNYFVGRLKQAVKTAKVGNIELVLEQILARFKNFDFENSVEILKLGDKLEELMVKIPLICKRIMDPYKTLIQRAEEAAFDLI